MDNMRVASQLVKLAKQLVGGPGSGVNFKLTDVDNAIFVVKYNNGKYQLKNNINIDVNEIEAKSYYEGDIISGSMIKDASIQINDEREVLADIKEIVESEIDTLSRNTKIELDVWLTYAPETMIHKGYSRGPLGDQLVFDCYVDASVSVDGEHVDYLPEAHEASIFIETGKRMKEWYEEIFLNY